MGGVDTFKLLYKLKEGGGELRSRTEFLIYVMILSYFVTWMLRTVSFVEIAGCAPGTVVS